MNDAEFEEFSRLWLEEEDPAEAAEFALLARRAEWRARLLRFTDYGLAALIVAGVAVAFSFDTAPATILFGLLFGASAVWATWKRRMLHQSALIAFDDREVMIDTARERCRLELRQSEWGLVLWPLGLFFALAVTLSSRMRGALDHLPTAVTEGVWSERSVLLMLILLILGEAYYIYRARRLRGELKRFDLLREQYRDESRRDRDAGAGGPR